MIVNKLTQEEEEKKRLEEIQEHQAALAKLQSGAGEQTRQGTTTNTNSPVVFDNAIIENTNVNKLRPGQTVEATDSRNTGVSRNVESPYFERWEENWKREMSDVAEREKQINQHLQGIHNRQSNSISEEISRGLGQHPDSAGAQRMQFSAPVNTLGRELHMYQPNEPLSVRLARPEYTPPTHGQEYTQDSIAQSVKQGYTRASGYAPRANNDANKISIIVPGERGMMEFKPFEAGRDALSNRFGDRFHPADAPQIKVQARESMLSMMQSQDVDKLMGNVSFEQIAPDGSKRIAGFHTGITSEINTLLKHNDSDMLALAKTLGIKGQPTAGQLMQAFKNQSAFLTEVDEDGSAAYKSNFQRQYANAMGKVARNYKDRNKDILMNMTLKDKMNNPSYKNYQDEILEYMIVTAINSHTVWNANDDMQDKRKSSSKGKSEFMDRINQSLKK